MKVHTDFTSNRHSLVFNDGKIINLTKTESHELNRWLALKMQTSNDIGPEYEATRAGFFPVDPD